MNHSIDELETEILDFAEGYGWVIEDLNDTPNGLRVKGKSWVARRNADTPIYGWNRREIAAELARWLLLHAETEGMDK